MFHSLQDSAGRHSRHGHLKDVICQALQRAQIPGCETAGWSMSVRWKTTRRSSNDPGGSRTLSSMGCDCCRHIGSISYIRLCHNRRIGCGRVYEVMKTSKYTDISIT